MSSKDIYEADRYAANRYAAGRWRGLGVTVTSPAYETARHILFSTSLERHTLIATTNERHTLSGSTP